MSPVATPPQGLNELTVTCRQCGAADMVRLDRKEYQCRHCGAITVISDSDAERLETLLRDFIARQSAATRQVPVPTPRGSRWARVAIGAAVGLVAGGAALLSHANHGSSGITSGNSADAYFAEQSVPNDRMVMSSLRWVPSASFKEGSYVGVVYNHSGYAIMPPTYQIDLFRNGMKDGSASAIANVSTLEPGEYMALHFDHISTQPDRYEVEPPTHIMHSSMETVAVTLSQPVLAGQVGTPSYSLVGVVRNNLKRPFAGVGELMLYGKDGQIIAYGVGSIPKLQPGEQTAVSLNAFFYGTDRTVTAYEYMLDAFYENTSQTVTLDEWKQNGKHTLPSRIVRVNAPQLRVMPDGDWKPEDLVHP